MNDKGPILSASSRGVFGLSLMRMSLARIVIVYSCFRPRKCVDYFSQFAA